MPTYDYQCDKCGNTFEKFEKMTAKSLDKCPKCGGILHRLIGGGSGILFKGTGFYETDYKKKSSPNKSCPKSGSDSCKGCPSNGA